MAASSAQRPSRFQTRTIPPECSSRLGRGRQSSVLDPIFVKQYFGGRGGDQREGSGTREVGSVLVGTVMLAGGGWPILTL